MKVPQIEYERVTLEIFEEKVLPMIDKIEKAASAAEVMKYREELISHVKDFETASTVAFIRNSLDTRDQFYDQEMKYYDHVTPVINNIYTKYQNTLLGSPHRKELEKALPETLFIGAEMRAKSSDDRIIEELRREAELQLEYNALMSQMTFEFGGKKIPLSILESHFQDSDRDTRRRAYEVLGRGLEVHGATIDRIYDDLVKVRDKMARKMGYNNFVEMGYYRLLRIDYDRNMVEKFRANVLKDLVPVISELRKLVAGDLGIEKLMFFDSEVCVAGGEPRPMLNKDGILSEAKKMYHEMDPEIGRFMDFMQENEALDVVAREGKIGGGYATEIYNYDQPFIMANFNGSSGDIDVMTHEFGHALAMKESFSGGVFEVGIGSMETAECHSMSMEFLCHRYMDRFFGADAENYKYKHLMESLSFVPFGVIIDEFQHIIYENPEMTPAERNETYKKLENKYRPYFSFEGMPYLEKGTRWQYKQHLFNNPFYYIDYCLATTVALSFYVMSRSDYDLALSRYLDFVKKGGTEAFGKLVSAAGLPSPFEDGALRRISEEIPAIIKDIRSKIS